MEDEPQINLKYGDQEFELRRDNTFLYRFLGALASRDHIFIKEDSQDSSGQVRGRYLFRQGAEEAFDTISDFMEDNGYFRVEGQREVGDCDERQYQKHLNDMVKNEADDIDYVPEDWQ